MAKPARGIPNTRLKLQREKKNWSQTYVATMIGTNGVQVSRWEHGFTFPSLFFRQELCKLFGMSSEELGLVPPTEEQGNTVENTPSKIVLIPHHRNPFFTGREEILQGLHEVLTSNKTAALVQAISGLGGVGKTQTAVEYAHRHQNDYEAILWAKADSLEMLVSDFVSIAHSLHLPQKDEQDQSHIVNAVKHWLREHAHWLLILDNVEDPAIIRDFIPTTSKGHILLTTRSQNVEGIAHPIKIKAMSLDEGTLLLLRRTHSIGMEKSLEDASEVDRTSARDIVSAMGGLPLALDQAGAYIESTGCSISDYLNIYRTHRAALLQKRGSATSDHQESVATTFSLTFQKIQQSHPPAAELMRLCAFLDSDEIPEEIFVLGAADLNPLLVPIVEDPLQLNETIGALLKYSLVSRNARRLSVHRLVQAVLQDEMDQGTRRNWAERTVRVVNRAFPEPEFAAWSRCQQYLTHAGVCATLIEQEKMVFPDAARLLHQAGIYLYRRGLYAEAEPFLKRALEIREEILGPNHTEVAAVLNDLAELYREMGKYTEAEPLVCRALEVRKQILGSVHLDVAASLHNLAVLCYIQRRFIEAETSFRESLEIREQMLGPVHPDVATSLHYLSQLCYEQRKYTDAKILAIKALEIREQVLGPAHPDVATSLNGLARLYREQGHFSEAELLFRKALAIRELILGPIHPEIARSLNNLAALNQIQGNYAEAELWFSKALEMRKQILGPAHIDILQCLHALAIVYQQQGKYAEAEPFYSRVLKLVEKMLELDPKYPDVVEGLHTIAALYERANGQYEAAESLVTRALQVFEKVLGPEHTSVATCSYYLAELYYAQGKHAEAEQYYQQALRIYEQQLGGKHPQTMIILERYARLSTAEIGTDRRSGSV